MKLVNQGSRHLQLKGLIQSDLHISLASCFLLSYRGINQAGQGTPKGRLVTNGLLDTSTRFPSPPPALHV